MNGHQGVKRKSFLDILPQVAAGATLTKERSEFEDRLLTYLPNETCPLGWPLKPQSLSPPICSSRGWKCIDVNMLQCVTCHSHLSAQLPDVWQKELYEDCVEELSKKLITGHKPNCPWVLISDPEDFYNVIPSTNDMLLQEFRSRLESLTNIREHLPQVKVSSIEQDILADNLTALSIIGKLSLENLNKCIIYLAVLGWKGFSSSKLSYVVCQYCFRKVASCFYKAAISETNDEICEAEVNTDVNDGETCDAFDPLYEHYDWCLWINTAKSSTNSDCSEKNNWQIFLQKLLKISEDCNGKENVTPISDRIKKARIQLEEWCTPEKNS